MIFALRKHFIIDIPALSHYIGTGSAAARGPLVNRGNVAAKDLARARREPPRDAGLSAALRVAISV